jgi:hypothetical protein
MAAAAALRSAARNLRAPQATFTAAAKEGQRRLLSSSTRTTIQARSPLRQLGRLRAEKLALEKRNGELLSQLKQCGEAKSKTQSYNMALSWLTLSNSMCLPLILILILMSR